MCMWHVACGLFFRKIDFDRCQHLMDVYVYTCVCVCEFVYELRYGHVTSYTRCCVGWYVGACTVACVVVVVVMFEIKYEFIYFEGSTPTPTATATATVCCCCSFGGTTTTHSTFTFSNFDLILVFFVDSNADSSEHY